MVCLVCSLKKCIPIPCPRPSTPAMPVLLLTLSYVYDFYGQLQECQELIPHALSSCLELHHSVRAYQHHVPFPHAHPNSPLCSLLVQNTMSALLAPDRIALLQWDFRVAVAAEVVNGGAFTSGLEGVSTRRGRHNGNLVSFTRHLEPLSPMLKE